MNNPNCWISTVDQQQADRELNTIYDRVRSPDGRLDNLYQGFSLRPHTILPADDLYLAAMHHPANTLPKWFSELLGTYVAILTGCEYALVHHGANYAHLVGDAVRSDTVIEGLKTDNLRLCGDQREIAALAYVKKLTLDPGAVEHADVSRLQELGWDDGEILEIVQVAGMFSYFVRVINGVGIALGDDKPGLY